MKKQKEQYDYVQTDKQYENYDLSNADYVTAEYIPAINPLNKGNPFIEALPHPKTTQE